MDAPQDMIKPVPASQRGGAPPATAGEVVGDADGAGFAEAMRAAQDASRPESREAKPTDAAAPKASRVADGSPEEDEEQTVVASANKGLLDAMLPSSAATLMPAPAADAAAAATTSGAPGPMVVAPPEQPAPLTGDPARIAETDAAAGRLAPAAVAVAVDRAIGNAIVSQPATGAFKVADTPAPSTADVATIASQGFVAAALQVAAVTPPVGSAVPEEARVGDPSPATDAEGIQTGTAPGAGSAWLAMRPDSLALSLADRAIARDPSAQVPPQIGATLQRLDEQLAALSGQMADGATASTPGGDEQGFGLALAAATGQANPASAAVSDSSTSAPLRLSVNAPVEQQTRWAAEFGDRLAWVASNRFSAATLQINPPQLGPIEVRILLNGDQANVSFAAVQPQTREAIQQALPTLATSFAAQGLSLGQTSVGRDNPQQQGGGNSNAAPGGGMLAGGGGIDAVSGGTGDATRGGQGLVDTFA